MNTLKKDWKPDLGIKHILLTIKCLLIVPNPESALNEEAGKLLLEQYDTYFSRAKLYTEIHANTAKSSSSKAEVKFRSKISPYLILDYVCRSVEKDPTTQNLPVEM